MTIVDELSIKMFQENIFYAPLNVKLNLKNTKLLIVGKVDVDSNQEFAAKYGVRNIPTVLLFKNGEVVDKQVGVAQKNVYTDKIDANL